MKFKRMSVRTPLWVAFSGLAACVLAWLFSGIYIYWSNTKLINFLAAWIPFVLSVLLAFVPEHEMTTMKKILWRCGVMFIGFAWSAVLWHQQVITEATAKTDQSAIVTDAVSKSNQHSDEQIGAVRKDLQAATTTLNSRLDGLSTQVSKNDTDVVGAISKVGVAPTKYARLQFSLYDSDGSKFPITTGPSSPDENGVFSIDFTATNTSDTSATSGDLWVVICDDCVFTKEPQGFDKPSGTVETVRHKNFGIVNPGVSIEKMNVEFRLKGFKPGQKYDFIGMSFRYSCATCGKIGEAQTIKLIPLLPTLHLPQILLPKSN